MCLARVQRLLLLLVLLWLLLVFFGDPLGPTVVDCVVYVF
jgi:hypothetical protein